jgi:integrase
VKVVGYARVSTREQAENGHSLAHQRKTLLAEAEHRGWDMTIIEDAHVRTHRREDGSAAYEVRWRQAGRFKQRTFKVKRDAERFALRVEDEVEQGNSTDIYVRRSKTVREVVEASMQASEAKLKPRTFASYRQSYDNHVLPTFGTRRVSTVTSQDVEGWVAGLTAKGLSPATVRNNFVALNKVMRYAVRHGLITRNPCTGTSLPTEDAEDAFTAQVLTPAQVEELAAELDKQAPCGLLVRFAVTPGLRAGELVGLRVRDINLLRRHVEVRQTVQRGKGGWIVGKPKSKRSSRDVPILRSALLDDLASYLATHPRRNEPDAALWPGRRPGSSALDYERRLDYDSFYRWYYRPALARTGLPAARFHDLRHTAATMWLAAGIPPYKVSRWLGHNSLTTTDTVYGHLYPSDYADDMARLDAYVDNAPEVRPIRK